ncbi:MAG: hypothetical protein V4583_16385 [Pseudomonadota bacterium]
MANALYNSFKARLLSPGVDLSAVTVKAALIDTGADAFNAADDFFDDVSAGVVGTPQTIGSKTFTNGVFDGADVTFTAVSGATAEAILLYVDTGTPATSYLIGFLDTGVTNLPVTPNGGDIAIAWDNGSSKIFAI